MKNKAQNEVMRSGLIQSNESCKNAQISKERHLPLGDGCSRTSLGTSVKSELHGQLRRCYVPFSISPCKNGSDLEQRRFTRG